MLPRLRVSFVIGLTLLFGILATAASHAAVLDASPDKVLLNGKIVTVDKESSIAEAVAIRDGKFVGVGTNEEIRKLAGPKTEVIDLKGKTIIPGFIDGHAHMDREGLKFLYPSLAGARSIKDILQIIEREVKKKKPGEWVITMPIGDPPYYYGGPELLEEKRFPNRWDLDKVSPNNPVYIRGIWYWWRGKPPIVSIANSKALKLAGITKNTMPPHTGLEIVKDYNTGEPTGVFIERGRVGTVEFSLMKVVPRFTHEQRVEGLRKSMQRYNAVGTTGIYEGHGISSVTLRAYKELWEKGEMTVRSYLVMSPAWDVVPNAKLDEVLRDWAAYAAGKGIGDDMLQLGGIHTVVGSNPQLDIRRKERPHPAWAGYGVDHNLPKERGSLYDLILATAKANLRANAIAAVPPVLNRYLKAFERVNKEIPIKDKRFVLIHLSFVSESNQKKIKELGVIPTIHGGSHLWKGASRNTKGLSEEKLNTYVPLKSLVDKGIRFVLVTDNVPINPLHSLWAAVARKDKQTGKVIVPSQKITREEALRAFTINGAYLMFEENIKGSIEVGKLADLAVLSADLLTVPEDEIRNIEVLMTMVGGKVVYRKALEFAHASGY